MFSRTAAILANDRATLWPIVVALALLLAALWVVWLFAAELSVVEVATSMRLETDAHVHPAEASVGGRIVEWRATLGEHVAEGEVLAVLETDHQKHALEEAEAQLEGWVQQLLAARDERDARSVLVGRDRTLIDRTRDEIGARRDVDLIAAEYAEKRAERSERLFELGLVSEVDLLHHQGDAEKARAEAAARLAETEAKTAELERNAEQHRANLAKTEREIGLATAEIATLEARIELLEHEIEDRHVRAPVAGRVGWLASRRVGSFAPQGERLAEIVPEQELQAVAHFPLRAIGRLQPGQTARLRLDALPWTEHGALTAVVDRIATEAQDGQVRVELRLAPDPSNERSDDATSSPILERLAHGMSGSAEVVVDRVSPAHWILRGVGRTMSPDTTPPGTTSPDTTSAGTTPAGAQPAGS